MRAFRALLDAGISIEEIMGVARVWGQDFSRIAEVEQRLFRKEFIDPLLRQRTSQREAEEIPEILEPLSRTLLDLLDGLLRNAHRRYLDMAVRQLVVSASDAGTEPHAVGFVDLVDYSRLSAGLGGEMLSDVVRRLTTSRSQAARSRDHDQSSSWGTR